MVSPVNAQRGRSALAAAPVQGEFTRRDWITAGAATLLTCGQVPEALAQVASTAAEEASAPPLPAVGSAWDLPAIERLDGSVYEPSSSQGRSLLVYWWASTCPFCALQSPSMEKLWRNQKASGLQMVALSIDRKPADALAYLARKGYTFPAAWASPDWRKRFPKPKGLPITLLRGRDGRLLLAEKGQMFDEDVEAIARLL
jgi:peroxiredoxin